MALDERTYPDIRMLPPSLQKELFSFLDDLLMRAEDRERGNWTSLSLSFAMRDMEDEEPLYTLSDLKVVFQ